LAFLKLGLTSFGGPIAHLGYFREAFVVERRWLDDHTYADLVALCQFLPGPASSQVGIAIGLSRAGYSGALAAWLGFTAPSAIAMVLFAYGTTWLGDAAGSGWLHGLKVAAVAVVAVAVLGMMRALTPDRERATIAAFAAIAMLAAPSALVQVLVIVLGGAAGALLLPAEAPPGDDVLPLKLGRRTGASLLAAFFTLLVGLPLLAAAFPSQTLKLIDAFYRAGSPVFGGGHVVLPLLQAAVVPRGWVSNDAFLAGYGAAQAVPGPLFTFAAYLGAAMGPSPNGWQGALIWSRRNLLAVLPARHRRAAVLGGLAPALRRARSTWWYQCRCGRFAHRRLLRSRLDRRHYRRERLRACPRGLPLALRLAGATLGRSDPLRSWRRAHRGRLRT
jgi:chromate transporter